MILNKNSALRYWTRIADRAAHYEQTFLQRALDDPDPKHHPYYFDAAQFWHNVKIKAETQHRAAEHRTE